MQKTRNPADLHGEVHAMAMKKITFSADADKIGLARRIAEAKGTTLEEEVRQWLKDLGEGRWKPTLDDAKKERDQKTAWKFK